MGAMLWQAIVWEGELPAAVVMAKREAMIVSIEEMDAKMRESGLRVDWFKAADQGVEGVAGTLRLALVCLIIS